MATSGWVDRIGISDEGDQTVAQRWEVSRTSGSRVDGNHGELQYYDPQQQLPMVLAQNKTGRVRKISPDLSGMIGDPEGSRKESTASGSKARVDLQA